MAEVKTAIREIEQMDSEIEDYFRRDRSGQKPRCPDYKGFINRVRAQWGRNLYSSIRDDRDAASSVLDKLMTYERIWDGQFMRYSDEREKERGRQVFLDKACDQICKETGRTVEGDVRDALISQYDQIIRSGNKPDFFYDKAANTFSVKAKK
ncbi:MAG: hypothetical protein JRE23_06890 [Deltaproteobacteria bacterium]|nr:hypothetical protein [Deltaproteobacteria bacterium]